MEQNYTQENLVQFIYRENSLTEHFEIENAIETDVNLKSNYKEIKNCCKCFTKSSIRSFKICY